MTTEYRALFDVRGSRYNLANRLYPAARREEAAGMLEHLSLSEGARWLDVGAGGGFLAAGAPEGSVPIGCDESAAFVAEAAGYALRAVADYTRLPFAGGTFDAAACLAVLHHAEDPGLLIAEMVRVTRRGGRAGVGDVVAGSRASRFLNGFVSAHTDMGHAGRFQAPEALARLFEAAGGRDVRTGAREIRWDFAGRPDAHRFCRELFGLRPDTGDADLDRALDSLGAAESDGRCVVPWDMVFASAAA
jgi:SAM-dependent methyltransferase